MNHLRIVAIIPARHASTRLPGKALKPIGGKPMILHVWERVKAATCLSAAVVATDDTRIYNAVTAAGGLAVMTSAEHPSGTDRCAEAVGKINTHCDAVINVQGDEPFINPEQIDAVGKLLQEGARIATLVKVISEDADLFNPSVVKAIVNLRREALYFSRSPVPFYRHASQNDWLRHTTYYKHVGIYGYDVNVLKEITRLPVSKLEASESLEQLRWLDNGYRIQTAVTKFETIGVDTAEDLAAAERLYHAGRHPAK